jgi:hypothetical protein
MNNDNLINWLTDSRSAEYFGRTFAIRADLLANLITGRGSVAEIAKEYSISLAAVYKHRKMALAIFQPKVDSGVFLKC